MKNILNKITYLFILMLPLLSCDGIPKIKRVYMFYDLKIESDKEKVIKEQLISIGNNFIENAKRKEDVIKYIPIQKLGGNSELSLNNNGNDSRIKTDSIKKYVNNIKFVKPNDCDLFFILDYIKNNLVWDNVDNYIVFLSNMININSYYDFNPYKCEEDYLDNKLKTFKKAKNDYDALLSKYKIDGIISSIYIYNVSSGSSNINCTQSEINNYWKGFFSLVSNDKYYINTIPNFKDYKNISCGLK